MQGTLKRGVFTAHARGKFAIYTEVPIGTQTSGSISGRLNQNSLQNPGEIRSWVMSYQEGNLILPKIMSSSVVPNLRETVINRVTETLQDTLLPDDTAR